MNEKSIASNFPADTKEILLGTLAMSPHGCGACAHAEWGGWTQHKYANNNHVQTIVPGASKKVFVVIGCRAGLIHQLPFAYFNFGAEESTVVGRHWVEFCTSQNAGLEDGE